MTASRSLVLTMAAMLTASVAVTACSSSSSGSPGGGKAAATARNSSAPGQSSSGSAAAAPAASGSATCKQLTPTDLQPLQTDKIVKVSVSVPPQLGTGQQCLFGTADSEASLAVEVASGATASMLYADDVQSATKPVSVSGIGDKAMHDAGDETTAISAFHAGEYCHVDTNDPGSVPGTDRLYVENGHHTDIGEPAFAIVAAAFGTVCNRIFGSGNTTPDLSGLASLHAPAPSDGGLPTNLGVPTDGPTS